MNEESKVKILNALLRTHNHNGEPIIFPAGQREIYRAIVFREHKRVQITCCTQYGKTHTVGVACLPVTCIEHRKVVIIAPTLNKAKLIMRDYIDHIGDDPIYYEELEKNTKLERLRMEESKERIMLKRGGGIYVISAQEGNSTKRLEAAMGEGAEIVILDEGALISDDTEATIYRMGAGQGDKFCYIKIGNPFTRGHFLTSFNDPKYHKIEIDYKQALAEGRYTESFIEEARRKPLFEVLYENKFPKEELIDSRGYRKLMTEDEIVKCQEDFGLEGETLDDYIKSELGKYENNLKAEDESQKIDCIFEGIPRLGGDIGRGGNKSIYVIRFNNYAIILDRNQIKDLMQQVPIIKGFVEQYSINPCEVAIDDTGIGGGVTDRLMEIGLAVNGVKVGEKPFDSDYLNIKAENMFLMRDWLVNQGGKLIKNTVWHEQLNIIRYKENSSSKLQIESKEDLSKQGIESPDDVDALALTFSNSPVTTANDFFVA